jgi:O-antigen/teichoic acid export membrane protein
MIQDLKGKTIRGSLVRIGAQVANLFLRMGALMILARLLSPKDFGLVGMVTACTGVLSWFRDFGLSSAVIQREVITEEQLSALFWINLAFGAILTLLTLTLAPLIAVFYRDPTLFRVTVALAFGFVFNGAGVQHSARLQREMRFTALAAINTMSLMVGIIIAVAGAAEGYRYWALVAMSVISPLTATMGFWMVTGWVPGRIRRGVGIRSMLRFGGTLTLNGLVAYFAFNADKIIVGRCWGPGAIGIYGRAFQLVSIPIDNLNSAVGEVAFSALSRLQDDPVRLRNYFLKGFSLVLGLTLPFSLACGLLADDGVFVLLGSKWGEAASIVRLLSPTIAIFAIINPVGWLLFSLGLVARGLRIALVFAPLMIAGYTVALPYGPNGVALAYSTVMSLWVLPHVLWCVHGTAISFRDVLYAACRPLGAGLAAGVVTVGFQLIVGSHFTPFQRLILESAVLFTAFFGVLLFIAGQKSLYMSLVAGLKGLSPKDVPGLASGS